MRKKVKPLYGGWGSLTTREYSEEYIDSIEEEVDEELEAREDGEGEYGESGNDNEEMRNSKAIASKRIRASNDEEIERRHRYRPAPMIDLPSFIPDPEWMRLERLQEFPPSRVDMPLNGEGLNNQDICYFCGEGSIEIDIYYCDGFCQRAICGPCLGPKTDLSDPWYCEECRNNIARCCFCSRPSLIWHLEHPLILPIDVSKGAKTQLEKLIRTEYVFRCAKQNCPSFFHLECVPRDPTTNAHVCFPKSKPPSSTDASRGITEVFRWYCPRHECDCKKSSSLFPTSVAHGTKRYCFRCPRTAHCECAKAAGWRPIINSELLMLCNRHTIEELYLPPRQRQQYKRPVFYIDIGTKIHVEAFYPLTIWLRFFKPPRDGERIDPLYEMITPTKFSPPQKVPPVGDFLGKIREVVDKIAKAAQKASDGDLIKMRRNLEKIIGLFDERIDMLWDQLII